MSAPVAFITFDNHLEFVDYIKALFSNALPPLPPIMVDTQGDVIALFTVIGGFATKLMINNVDAEDMDQIKALLTPAGFRFYDGELEVE
jgi:hypothetical protein